MADSSRNAPGVRITLLADEKSASGEALSLDGGIVSFSFEEAAKKAEKVSLQLDNCDLALLDRYDLAGGATLKVSWGYPGNMSPPRSRGFRDRANRACRRTPRAGARARSTFGHRCGGNWHANGRADPRGAGPRSQAAVVFAAALAGPSPTTFLLRAKSRRGPVQTCAKQTA